MFCLRRIIKERSIDIINTHSGKDTWVGGVAAKMGGAKFIRTRHLANPINPSRFNFINELADHVITTGDTVRDAMIRDNRIKPERITSIPTMPDHRKFSPDNYSRTDERKRLGLKEAQVAVGIVGVLRRVKRHDLFLDMAQAILNECPDTRFVIAGDGPLDGDLRRMVRLKGMEGAVIFTGHLEDPGSVMAALDIYVQTSDSETTTQTVPQALLMGLPVVSTDVGSVRQNYHENNFILVEPDNVERLVEAVGMLARSRKARKGYAAGARASVPSDYSSEKMAEKVLGIYNRLLAT